MMITPHLIVEEYGAFIGKHSERIIVKRKDEKLTQAPLLHLESVLIAGAGASISRGGQPSQMCGLRVPQVL